LIVNDVDHVEVRSEIIKAEGVSCDIFKAYEIFKRGHDYLDATLKFAKDDYLGYTTIFSNCLEVINVFVKIHLPSYDGYKDQMSAEYILKKYRLIFENPSEFKILRNADKLETG
jgi:protein-arginine kinase